MMRHGGMTQACVRSCTTPPKPGVVRQLSRLIPSVIHREEATESGLIGHVRRQTRTLSP